MSYNRFLDKLHKATDSQKPVQFGVAAYFSRLLQPQPFTISQGTACGDFIKQLVTDSPIPTSWTVKEHADHTKHHPEHLALLMIANSTAIYQSDADGKKSITDRLAEAAHFDIYKIRSTMLALSKLNRVGSIEEPSPSTYVEDIFSVFGREKITAANAIIRLNQLAILSANNTGMASPQYKNIL